MTWGRPKTRLASPAVRMSSSWPMTRATTATRPSPRGETADIADEVLVERARRPPPRPGRSPGSRRRTGAGANGRPQAERQASGTRARRARGPDRFIAPTPRGSSDTRGDQPDRIAELRVRHPDRPHEHLRRARYQRGSRYPPRCPEPQRRRRGLAGVGPGEGLVVADVVDAARNVERGHHCGAGVLGVDERRVRRPACR